MFGNRGGGDGSGGSGDGTVGGTGLLTSGSEGTLTSGVEEGGAGELFLALCVLPQPEKSKATSAIVREVAIIPGLNLCEFI